MFNFEVLNLEVDCKEAEQKLLELFLKLGPSYMVSGTRDNPPPELSLSSVYIWKRGSCRPSQS